LSAHYPGRAAIEAYCGGEFRFAGMVRVGSLLALPSGIYEWAPRTLEDLRAEHFEPLIAERSAIDFVVFGSGSELKRPPPYIRKLFADRKLPFDIMDTGAAVRTYNVVLAEGRRAAAALIATRSGA
jgi:uncharacterized protein